jgi:hypothetical protein
VFTLESPHKSAGLYFAMGRRSFYFGNSLLRI